jgi:hypothetical protein
MHLAGRAKIYEINFNSNLVRFEAFPNVIFNGKNCKYTLISMNNTKVIERNGKFEKDKSSERKKKVLPEEAIHFSDAIDKRIWTKYGKTLYSRSSGTYVEPRL